MVTPAAERKRRSRAHAKGDHSLCDPARCPDWTSAPEASQRAETVTPEPVTPVTPPAVAAVKPPAEPDRPAGEIEAEVREFVGQLKFKSGDPRRILGSIAVKLARRIDDASATASAVRELSVLLGQLAEAPDQPAGPLDGTRATRAARRIDGLVRQAS